MADQEKARVARASNGDWQVKIGKRLISNHGRREAEARRKAEQLNKTK
jgi:hypothetical protein